MGLKIRMVLSTKEKSKYRPKDKGWEIEGSQDESKDRSKDEGWA